jgi:GNAT superfamily N-acetyltransferase
MHLLAFRGFFLASLGRGFLRMFYREAAGHEQTVGYVAMDEEGKVVGASFGLMDPGAFYRDLFHRRKWAFALRAIRAVLSRPWILPRLVRARKHRGNPPPVDLHPLGALPSTAVEPGNQGLGVAIALMRAACQEFARRGVHAVYLTTDADGNDRVRGFYRAMGWKFIGYYATPEKRRMCWYLWLDPAVHWPTGAVPDAAE